jgi:hypothetical protein
MTIPRATFGRQVMTMEGRLFADNRFMPMATVDSFQPFALPEN